MNKRAQPQPRSEICELRLARVSQLLDAEETEKAAALLARIASESDASGLEHTLLTARLELLERRYRALAHTLARARAEAAAPEDLRRIELLAAHGEALSGQARTAFINAAKLIRQTQPMDELQARARWVAGLSCYRGGHYTWALRFTEDSAAYYRLLRDQPLMANLFINMALIRKNQGRVDLALSHLDEALANLPKDGFPRIRTRLLINRSVCFIRLGRIEPARVSLMEAKQIDTESRAFAASINNNLGHVYRMLGNHKLAAEFYQTALGDARTQGSRRKQCLAHEFLAETATESQDLATARTHLESAFRLAQAIAPHGDLMMEVLRRRGELWAALEEEEQAAKDLHRAIDLCTKRMEKRELVLARRALLFVVDPGIGNRRTELQAMLSDIHELGDSFEWARTVCLALERWQLPTTEDWVRDTVALAIYHADISGSPYWKSRLRAFAGHSRQIRARRRTQGPEQPPILETSSPLFQACLDSARVAIRSERPVMILGETGVGKEVVARAIHSWGKRSQQPLVAINCGAIPETLVESELFGHARGSFTGAVNDKPGLFEMADRGTVFLDEVSHLPKPTQIKLLRFLDSGEFRRIGETEPRRADVRVLSATNHDPVEDVANGSFRSDLYYRLNVFQLQVPPLRERCEDVHSLAFWFMRQEGVEIAEPFDASLQGWMRRYHWPGNIRELKNVCEYLSAKTWGKRIASCEDLPSHLMATGVRPGADFDVEREELERKQLTSALRRTGGRIADAAKILGMSRNTLSRRMRTLGINRESFVLQD